jgi:hypothetical protein
VRVERGRYDRQAMDDHVVLDHPLAEPLFEGFDSRQQFLGFCRRLERVRDLELAHDRRARLELGAHVAAGSRDLPPIQRGRVDSLEQSPYTSTLAHSAVCCATWTVA